MKTALRIAILLGRLLLVYIYWCAGRMFGVFAGFLVVGAYLVIAQPTWRSWK